VAFAVLGRMTEFLALEALVWSVFENPFGDWFGQHSHYLNLSISYEFFEFESIVYDNFDGFEVGSFF